MRELVVVEKGPLDDGSCSFCTSRNPAEFKLSSTSSARRLVVFLCKRCAWDLSQQLNELGA